MYALPYFQWCQDPDRWASYHLKANCASGDYKLHRRKHLFDSCSEAAFGSISFKLLYFVWTCISWQYNIKCMMSINGWTRNIQNHKLFSLVVNVTDLKLYNTFKLTILNQPSLHKFTSLYNYFLVHEDPHLHEIAQRHETKEKYTTTVFRLSPPVFPSVISFL
jgi:hypothetical protein